MRNLTIVVGWYKRWHEDDTPNQYPRVHEIKVRLETELEDKEEIKQVVAKQLGSNYPDVIDFRYFDISEDNSDKVTVKVTKGAIKHTEETAYIDIEAYLNNKRMQLSRYIYSEIDRVILENMPIDKLLVLSTTANKELERRGHFKKVYDLGRGD